MVLTWFPGSRLTVTIARAIELKHNATLVAALSYETANFYQRASESPNL